jgi:hypothetical protein
VLTWVPFAVELAALVILALQRRGAEKRGEESWLIQGLWPAIARAIDAGEARQADHPGRLPLDEERLRRRIHHLVTAWTLVFSLPGLLAIVASGWPWETLVLTFAGTMLIGIDAVAACALIVATWRGWMPLPDDDDDGDDDDEPEPVTPPGGPWTRAHQFNLLR